MNKEKSRDREEAGKNQKWPYRTPGIPDDQFITGDVPLTKRDVRVVSLSRLQLQPNQVIWDVGAGTGTIAIECAMLIPESTIYALEKDTDAITLLNENIQQFQVDNINVVEGEAPDTFSECPAPDRIFIGGSGQHRRAIIKECASRLQPNGRLIINAVTMDSITETFQTLSDTSLELADISSVAINQSEPIAGYQFMKAKNQVYIFTAVNTR